VPPGEKQEGEGERQPDDVVPRRVPYAIGSGVGRENSWSQVVGLRCPTVAAISGIQDRAISTDCPTSIAVMMKPDRFQSPRHGTGLADPSITAISRMQDDADILLDIILCIPFMGVVPDYPTLETIDEKMDRVQILLRIAGLGAPAETAVGGVENRPVVSDHPALPPIGKELNGGEIIDLVNAERGRPGLATIAGVYDCPASTAHPTLSAISQKIKSSQECLDLARLADPGRPTISSVQDRPASSDCPALATVGQKLHVLEVLHFSTQLWRPGMTPIGGVKDGAVRADDPAFLVVDKVDSAQIHRYLLLGLFLWSGSASEVLLLPRASTVGTVNDHSAFADYP